MKDEVSGVDVLREPPDPEGIGDAGSEAREGDPLLGSARSRKMLAGVSSNIPDLLVVSTATDT